MGCPRRAAPAGHRSRTRTPLDEAILRAFGAQLGGDSLADRPLRADHANVYKEKRPVLDIKAPSQLGILDHGTIVPRQPVTSQVILMALV
jgi:hypothetical protein